MVNYFTYTLHTNTSLNNFPIFTGLDSCLFLKGALYHDNLATFYFSIHNTPTPLSQIIYIVTLIENWS